MGTKTKTKTQRQARTSRNKKRRILIDAKFIALLIGVSALVAWTFYDSIYAMAIIIPLFPVVGILYTNSKYKKQLEISRRDFKDMLVLLSGFMQAGESMESALYDTQERLIQAKTCSKHAMKALYKLNQRVGINIALETAFYEFADDLDLEEAYEFSDILSFAKRMGGNYNYHVKRTAKKIEEKLDLLSDISVMMAEKVLEMKVMMAMPIGIIAYIKITSFDFIAGMYHNVFGVVSMSIALCIYAAMIVIGFKIIDIKV